MPATRPAEDKTGAGHDVADAEAFDQNIDHKILGGTSRHHLVEVQADHEIEANIGQMAGLLAKRRQAKRHGRGLEEFARMRFEGNDAPRFVGVARDGAGPVDHRTMAAMHAVEIAQRHNSAAQVIRGRTEVVPHDHGVSRNVKSPR